MPFARSEGRIQKFKETRDARYIHRNELNRTCFQADITYGDIKDYLDNHMSYTSDKVLRNKTFDISKSLDYDQYQSSLVFLAYQFLKSLKNLLITKE